MNGGGGGFKTETANGMRTAKSQEKLKSVGNWRYSQG